MFDSQKYHSGCSKLKLSKLKCLLFIYLKQISWGKTWSQNWINTIFKTDVLKEFVTCFYAVYRLHLYILNILLQLLISVVHKRRKRRKSSSAHFLLKYNLPGGVIITKTEKLRLTGPLMMFTSSTCETDENLVMWKILISGKFVFSFSLVCRVVEGNIEGPCSTS